MLRRSKRLLYAQSIFPEAKTVYRNSDLIFHIRFYLDWPTLFRLSQASRESRQLVRDETHNRLRTFLRPFVALNIYDAFMTMLRSTRGAIVGGIPYCFLTSRIPFSPHPLPPGPTLSGILRGHPTRSLHLRLLVPDASWETTCDWLAERGYTRRMNADVSLAFEKAVSEIAVFNRPKMASTDYLCKIPCYISLSRVKTNVINACLSTPFTCHTNLITGSTILSFFPKATTKRTCMRSDAPIEGLTYPRLHFYTCIAPHDGRRPCGTTCPARERRVRATEKTKFFHFDDPIDDALVVSAARSKKRFGYQPRCYNVRCPNHRPEFQV